MEEIQFRRFQTRALPTATTVPNGCFRRGLRLNRGIEQKRKYGRKRAISFLGAFLLMNRMLFRRKRYSLVLSRYE